MVLLHDKRCGGIDYNSLEEIAEDVGKGKNSFVVEIPNATISGLDLEFFIQQRDGTSELFIRLMDGESYRARYAGYRKVGEFNPLEAAKQIARINEALRTTNYQLTLELVPSNHGFGGGDPYYRICSFSIDWKEMVRTEVLRR